jgi:hypothetical protein
MLISDFTQIYSKLCYAFNKDVKRGQLMVYWEYLNKCDVEAFRYATSVIIKHSKFFPSISDLLDIMSNYRKRIPEERQINSNEVIPNEMPEDLKNLLKADLKNFLKGEASEA